MQIWQTTEEPQKPTLILKIRRDLQDQCSNNLSNIFYTKQDLMSNYGHKVKTEIYKTATESILIYFTNAKSFCKLSLITIPF